MSQAEQREEAIFEAALQLPADQRAAFLEKECGAEADLRRRVEVLLGAFERAGGFMKQPAAPERTVHALLPPIEKPGDRIGRYKLLEQIGEGGCGVVYVAEQEVPVRRRVALKVIKLGMDTKQVIARFDAERQALAMMDHPNIAKIHDAGITGAPTSDLGSRRRGAAHSSSAEGQSRLTSAAILSAGRPYFVMELVRGIKITDFCEQHHLPPRERLDLFIQVCRAIQHAHQKGVIHRDIKPSNILVTLHDGVPVPKVIDFGIAKATQGRLTDQTVYTAFEQFIGTPAYMSPEQAEMSGLDIDTRSDIYSLGVLLYELLTGTTPFDAKELLSKGLDEMRRTIREVEPVKPSTRLTQDLVAADVSPIKSHESTEGKVRADSRRLLLEVRGDLDWIVMKCLEKDRTRRYETANGLATDISRHLNNEPVVARPPSRLYRFQKSVQRNKLAFGIGLVAALAAVLGLVLLSISNVRIDAARRAERAQRQKAEAANQQLRETIHLLDHTRLNDWSQDAVDLRAAERTGVLQRVASNEPFSAPVSRTAIQFDRITASVQISHASALNPLPMTFAAWIKTDHSAFPGDVGIMKKVFHNTCDGYAVYLLGGHLRAWYLKDCTNRIYNGTWSPRGSFDGGFVADGRWHHVAFIVDTSQGTLCIDGKATTTLAWTGAAGAPTNTAPLRFGHHDGEFSLGGLMCEVTLWNRALSEVELHDLMQSSLTGKESGLVAYWPFDEGSGNVAHDHTGHGHDGSLDNGAAWAPAEAPAAK